MMPKLRSYHPIIGVPTPPTHPNTHHPAYNHPPPTYTCDSKLRSYLEHLLFAAGDELLGEHWVYEAVDEHDEVLDVRHLGGRHNIGSQSDRKRTVSSQ